MSCSYAAATSNRRSSSGIAAATDCARAATSRAWCQRSPKPANRRPASSDSSQTTPTCRPFGFACTSANGTPGPECAGSRHPPTGESDAVNLGARRWRVSFTCQGHRPWRSPRPARASRITKPKPRVNVGVNRRRKTSPVAKHRCPPQLCTTDRAPVGNPGPLAREAPARQTDGPHIPLAVSQPLEPRRRSANAA